MAIKLKTFGAPVVILGYRYLGVEPGVDAARQAFGLSLTLVFLTCAFLYSKINKARLTADSVKIKSKNMQGEETEETKTFMAHDTDELFKLVKQTAIGAVMVAGLHLWKGYTQPLVFQALLLPLSAIDSPLFHIYILGAKAENNLQRPWKEDNPFAALQQSMSQNADGDANAAEAVTDGEEKDGTASSSNSKKTKKEAKKSK